MHSSAPCNTAAFLFLFRLRMSFMPQAGKKLANRRKQLGYNSWKQMLKSMPDICEVKYRPDIKEEWIYPAPEGILPPPNMLVPIPEPSISQQPTLEVFLTLAWGANSRVLWQRRARRFRSRGAGDGRDSGRGMGQSKEAVVSRAGSGAQVRQGPDLGRAHRQGQGTRAVPGARLGQGQRLTPPMTGGAGIL